MVAANKSAVADPADVDQRVFMRQVPWWTFEAMLAFRGERPSPRFYYLDGDLELMSPSRSHEGIETAIARLLEVYALHHRIKLAGYGSWTLRTAPRQTGAEPDECYIVGADKETPDLAIEVVLTSGGLNKMEIYRRLGVRELWVWQDEQLAVHVLRDDAYHASERSELFPRLDFTQIASYVLRADQADAVLEYADALKS